MAAKRKLTSAEIGCIITGIILTIVIITFLVILGQYGVQSEINYIPVADEYDTKELETAFGFFNRDIVHPNVWEKIKHDFDEFPPLDAKINLIGLRSDTG